MRVAQFYVRSNVHMTNLDSAINRLLLNESLIDVTLACDGHRFQCHRLVLAAASPLFEELLKEHPKEHPIVIIPIGVKWHILKSLIDFMYRGQTCINQAELKTLIESAELLQVIGLYDPQTQFREFYGEDDNDNENLNLDQQNGSTTVFNSNNDDDKAEEEGEDDKLNQPITNINNIENSLDHEQSQNHSEDQPENHQEIAYKDGENINDNDDENNGDKSKERIVDFIEIDDSQDELTINPDEDCASTKNQMTMTNEETNEINCSIPISNHQNHTETNNEEEDTTEVEETKLLENNILQNVPNLTINETTTTTTTETMPTIRVKPTIKLINLFKLNRPGQIEGNQSPSNVPWTYIHIPAPLGSNIQSPSTQVPLNSNATAMTWPPLVNTLPQLMPVATAAAVFTQPLKENTNETIVECSGAVPSFLKFNSSSMAISVKNLDRTRNRQKLNVLNMALESESTDQQQLVNHTEDEEEEEVKDQQDQQDGGENNDPQQEPLDPGDLCRIKQELEVKTESMEFDSDDRDNNNKIDETEAENIICQPNVSYIYDGHEEYGKDVVEHVDDDEDGICIDYDRLVAETYGNMQQHPSSLPSQKSTTKKKPNNKKFKKSSKIQLRSLAPAVKNCNDIKSMTTMYQPTTTTATSELTNSHPHHNHHHQRLKDPPTLVPLSVMNAGLGPKHLYYHHNKTNNNNKIDMNEKIDKSFISKNLSIFGEEETTTMADLTDSHTQNSVILRNPRCNQPRHYSNESLYAALMAVKYGDSIYRASRLHQVPRKTLRNWMKRWDIKSQYPMPKQLKDAAKKKKLNNQNQSA